MATDKELVKLPLSLGLKVNEILKEKIQFIPRKNMIGMFSFEYTKDELALIDKLKYDNPVTGEIEGIELLPKLKTLIIKSNTNASYQQDRLVASISDKDGSCIEKCKNLEYLKIENQARLSFIDVSQMKKLHYLFVNKNMQLEEISGLDSIKELEILDCIGNEALTQIEGLNNAIMNNQELTELNLDVLLFPDAVGYDVKTGKCNDATIKKFEEMDISWQEILTIYKSTKINNNQMLNMHEKAIEILEEYVPQYCDRLTTIIGIEQYLVENVKYDYEALNTGHSHSYSSENDKLPSITIGPKHGANGAYNAFTYNTCVCQGYTRAMQYLLRLKGIKTHNVRCISGEDKLHMSTDKEDDKYKTYQLPNDGYHSIISIDDFYCLYDDPCWNAGRYQKGDKSMPWTLLTKEEISKDHTLSFGERNINNNNLRVPRSAIEIAQKRIVDYRNNRKNSKKAIFFEQEIGKSTIDTPTSQKDRSAQRMERDGAEIDRTR